MDNLKIKGPLDRYLISLEEPWEVAYWSQHFRITKEELRQIVHRVGNRVVDVENYIKRSR